MKAPTSLVRLVISLVLFAICAYVVVSCLRKIYEGLDTVANKVQLIGEKLALLTEAPIEVEPKGEIGFAAILRSSG